MKARFRRMTLQFAALAVLFAAVVASATVIIDPLQFYHKATWYDPVFSNEQRYQNPGLARNYAYDTIIIGTSMTENFVPSRVGEALGGQVLKLSIRGSTADEHRKIANVALETGKVRKVLWGLDYFSLKRGGVVDFPAYMYDDKLWNDYPYLFNYSVYEQFLKSVKRKLDGHPPQNLDNMYSWDKMVVYGKGPVAKSFATAAQQEIYFGLNEESLDEIKRSFTDNILSVVQEHPEVEFYFYYPPYSALRQVVWYNTNPVRFENQLTMRKWMYEQFAQHPNVKLYDFQVERDWTYDLDLYKDLSHHKGELNQLIAEAIGKDDPAYRVTDETIDDRNEALSRDASTATIDEENHVVNIEILKDGETAPFFHKRLTANGQVLVSAKEASKLFGLALAWDKAKKQLGFNGGKTSIAMTIGESTATVNQRQTELEAPAMLIEGTSYVPLKFLAGQLGFRAVQSAEPYDGGRELHVIRLEPQ